MRDSFRRKGARHHSEPPALPANGGVKKRASGSRSGIPVHGRRGTALPHSEEWYRMLVESAPVGVGICNYRGDVLACNSHWRTLAGLDPEDPAKACGHCFERAQHQRFITQLRKVGSVDGWEAAFLRKDGTRLSTLVRMKPIRLDKDELVLAIVQDMTRQKRAERHVEGTAALLGIFASQTSREAYLKAVVRLLAAWCDCRCVGIRLARKDGRMPFAAHQGFARSFLQGENRDRLEWRNGCLCFRVLAGHPRPEDEAWSSLGGSVFCNEVHQCVAQWGGTGRSSRRLPCATAGYQSLAQVPIRNAGRLLGTLHLADRRASRFPIHTVTFLETVAPLIGEALYRFAVEQSLAESEARFRSLFEHHDAAMVLFSAETGALVDVNPAAAAFYGYSRERLREMSFGDLTTLPRSAQVPYKRRTLREGRIFVVVPQRLANGQIRTVEVHGSLIQIGGKRRVFAIIHDITERKLLEKAILEISEKERQRVGHDLHDSLGSKLSGAALMGKALAQQLAAKGVPEAALAEEVVECINQSVRQTRTIARGLCPAELAVSGLTAALEELAAETQRLSGVACRFEAAKGVVAPDRFTGTHLFRIAQEAVNNALRHGVARHITLRLTRIAKHLCLEISDDGVGLGGNRRAANGLGLRSMKYRAGVIGGLLTVESNPGAGATVRCLTPLVKSPPDAVTAS